MAYLFKYKRTLMLFYFIGVQLSLVAAQADSTLCVKMSSVNKFLLVFPSVFWDNTIQYVGYTPDTKGKFNYFMNMKKFIPQNALMTFAFGNYGAVTETMTDAQVTNEIMLHLKSIYGNIHSRFLL